MAVLKGFRTTGRHASAESMLGGNVKNLSKAAIGSKIFCSESLFRAGKV